MTARIIYDWDSSATLLCSDAPSHCCWCYAVICFYSCTKFLRGLLKLLLHLHLLVIGLWSCHATLDSRNVCLVFVTVGLRSWLAFNSSLVFNFYMNWIINWFSCSLSLWILNSILCMNWNVSYGTNSSIHGIIHHLTAFVQIRSAHIEWILTISTIASIFGISRSPSRSSGIWHYTSSNYS